MKNLDKSFLLPLLIVDALAILVGMVTGPLGYDAVSIGASLSACILSAAVVVYGLLLWPGKRRR